MLFHCTIRHDVDNCAGFDPELRARVLEGYSRIDDVAAKFGVVVRDLYNAAPDHVEYMVAEARDNMSFALFLGEALPYRAEYETHPVADRVALGEMMAGSQ